MSVDIYSKIEYDVTRKGIYMEKIVIILVLVLLMFCSCKEEKKPPVVIYEHSSVQKQESTYLISYYGYDVENDSVGSQWEEVVKYEGREISSNSKIVFEGEELELVLCAIEKDDKADDIGEKTIRFSKLEIGEEEKIIEFIEVVENGGAYKGNKAVFKFTVTLERIS